jgi:hypothetical protein
MGRYVAWCLWVLAVTNTHAQLVKVPVAKTTLPKSNVRARTASVPLTIPFWDDFSFTTNGFPIDTLWDVNSTASISTGNAINPPSVNVATFDGVKNDGTFYGAENENGFTDQLQSLPIDLSANSSADPIYLSFFYQWQGHSNAPEASDYLVLEFKNTVGNWIEQARFQNNQGLLNPTVFYDTLIKIPDGYFHADFQFRFRSYGRQNGAFDSWHVDYIFLGEFGLPARQSFPDRAATSYPSPLFKKYFSVPLSHFDSVFSSPTFGIYNLSDVDLAAGTNVDYQPEFIVKNFSEGSLISDGTTTTAEPQDLKDNIPAILALEKIDVVLTSSVIGSTGLPSLFDSNSDSTVITLRIPFRTNDVDSAGVPKSDYKPRFRPVEFRWNDTIQSHYILSSFYAYDDGTAENAARLEKANMRGAYRFDTYKADTLIGVYVHHPIVGGTFKVNSNVVIQILRNDNGEPGNVLYEESIPVVSSANHAFVFHRFLQSVLIQDTSFFFAWKSDANGFTFFGLDGNNDTGDRMYYSENESWTLNDDLRGSLMIRPVFGTGTVVTSPEEEIMTVLNIYPNPSEGVFRVSGTIHNVQIINALGQPVLFHQSSESQSTIISLSNATPGVYFIRGQAGKILFSSKVVVAR